MLQKLFQPSFHSTHTEVATTLSRSHGPSPLILGKPYETAKVPVSRMSHPYSCPLAFFSLSFSRTSPTSVDLPPSFYPCLLLALPDPAGSGHRTTSMRISFLFFFFSTSHIGSTIASIIHSFNNSTLKKKYTFLKIRT